MLSRLVALISIASVAVAVTIDSNLCYTLTKDNVVNYLDSKNSVLDVENHPDRQALIDDNDKGVRFRFPGGINGPVVCQAHNDHFVGLSGSDFRTDVNGNANGRSSVTDGGSGVFIQTGPTFIGPDGKASSNSFLWELNEIVCANLD